MSTEYTAIPAIIFTSRRERLLKRCTEQFHDAVQEVVDNINRAAGISEYVTMQFEAPNRWTIVNRLIPAWVSNSCISEKARTEWIEIELRLGTREFIVSEWLPRACSVHGLMSGLSGRHLVADIQNTIKVLKQKQRILSSMK